MVREHHWKPEEIDGLYLDDADHFGIELYYNDIKEMTEKIEKMNTEDTENS